MAALKSPKQLATFLAYILERRPDEFGLVTDPQGYTKVKELLKAVTEELDWKYVRRSHLDEIMLTIPNPPFEIADNLIRAKCRQHLPKQTLAHRLPKLLFTSIRRKAYPSVMQKGITPMGYAHVILSSQRGLAQRIGKRIDQAPVLLTVQVQSCLDRGVVYYRAGESLYLADAVPAGCFTGPPLPKEKTAGREQLDGAIPAQQATAGSYRLSQDKTKPVMPPAYKQGHTNTRQGKKSKTFKPKRQPPPWRR